MGCVVRGCVYVCVSSGCVIVLVFVFVFALVFVLVFVLWLRFVFGLVVVFA